MLVTSRLSGGKEIGPQLEHLPEELLAALSKFLFIGRDVTEQGDLSKENMEQLRNIVRYLNHHMESQTVRHTDILMGFYVKKKYFLT